MCGGFVALYAGESSQSNVAHIAYNTGRLLTYLILGALAGFIGSQMDLAAVQAGITPVSALLMGGLLVLWGILLLLRGGVRTRSILHGKTAQALGRVIKVISTSRSWSAAFLIGLLSTLLPCGWLYSFVLLAAASGSALGGVLVMAAFWLGTIPVMALIGRTIHAISNKWGTQLPYVTAVLMIIAGIFAMTGKLLPGFIDHHHHH